MKKIKGIIPKNRTVPLFIFLILVSLFIFNINAYSKDEKTILGKDQINEQIIVRDVTLEAPVSCGKDAVVVNTARHGLRWINIISQKEIKISSGEYDGAIDCTSDGEWVIYVDSKSSRWDKGSYERGVKDFWRFNLITGKRQKFAIASGGGTWSPDVKKFLFYGSKPVSAINQPEPIWELVWPQNKWKHIDFKETHWVNNSTIIMIKKNELYIEEIDKNSGHQLNHGFKAIKHLETDKLGRIYLLATSKSDKTSSPINKYDLFRCSIDSEKLRCEDLLKRDKSISAFDVTQDGSKIVFKEESGDWQGDVCVWLYTEGLSVKCITPQASVHSILKITPDAKYILYSNYRKFTKDTYTNDLKIIKTINN